MTDLIAWEQDKALYLFTSLTAGSSHVITATSRIDTILRAARIPFSYIDTATNEGAKKLYQRRGKGKKLPLLVKEGFVIGDLEQIEEWNEFGELKEAIGPVAMTETSHTTAPLKPPSTGSAAPASTPQQSAPGAEAPGAPLARNTGLEASLAASSLAPSVSDALRKAAFESASAAKDKQSTSTTRAGTSTASSAPGVLPAAAVAALKSPSETVPPPPVSTPITGDTPTIATLPQSLDKATPQASPLGKHSESSVAPEAANPVPSTASSGPAPPPPPPPPPAAAAVGAAAVGAGAADAAASTVPASKVTSATSSISSFINQQQPFTPTHFDPPATMHRGSSVSLASQEEIKAIECREAIPEEEAEHSEDAENDDDGETNSKASGTTGAQTTQPAVSKVEAVKQVVADEQLSVKDKVVEAAKVVTGAKDEGQTVPAASK